jgi:hypothetical protein
MADRVAILCQCSQANKPGLSTQPTVLSSNPARAGFMIQNQGTNPIFVALGSGATNDVYHIVLKGGTAVSDGNGGTFVQTSGAIYTGIITMSGTSPTYTVLEL